jgi:hypothetical protein
MRGCAGSVGVGLGNESCAARRVNGSVAASAAPVFGSIGVWPYVICLSVLAHARAEKQERLDKRKSISRDSQRHIGFETRSRGYISGRTHVLLPVNVLLRQADDVAVIGTALEGKTAGRGHRAIACELGRAP